MRSMLSVLFEIILWDSLFVIQQAAKGTEGFDVHKFEVNAHTADLQNLDLFSFTQVGLELGGNLRFCISFRSGNVLCAAQHYLPSKRHTVVLAHTEN